MQCLLRNKRAFTKLVFMLWLAMLTGCATKKNEENFKVRIAYFPNITHSQALIGKAEGQFQAALGDDTLIEWKQFNAGPAEIEAFFAGEVDIGYIGPGPAINGYVKSKGDIQIIAGSTNAGAIFVSRKDLVIKDLKELSGKKIAVSQFGNTQDLSFRNILTENGLQDTTKGGTVEILQVENPDIKTLLENGEIDGALVPEPWGSRLIQEIGANIILDYDEVWREGKYSTAVVVARKEFIAHHPQIIEKFLTAHVALTESIPTQKETSKTTLNTEIEHLTGKSLAKEVLDMAFDKLTVTYDPEKESIVAFCQLLKSAGYLKEEPDLENLFYMDPLKKVLKEKQ